MIRVIAALVAAMTQESALTGGVRRARQLAVATESPAAQAARDGGAAVQPPSSAPDAGVVLLEDGGIDPDTPPASGCSAAEPVPVLHLPGHSFRRYGVNQSVESGVFPDGSQLVIHRGGCADSWSMKLSFQSPRFQFKDRRLAVHALLPLLEAHRADLAETPLVHLRGALQKLREFERGAAKYDSEEGLCLLLSSGRCISALHIEVTPGAVSFVDDEEL
jgi:hypothetical protein